MARPLVVLLTVVLFECVAAVVFGRLRLAPHDSEAVPHAVVPDTLLDFGEVPAGRPLTAHFPVENHGARRLVLTQLDASCDCIRGDRPEIVVGAGESSDIQVRLETEELSGPMQLDLRYATNDPILPTIAVRVLADVTRGGAR
ncbi:MAG TPA: DUF1573 domain-containing protein [Pirellulales bacterium]|nr:DUF1573 domain-containing protein [Pirellulales bacterium]